MSILKINFYYFVKDWSIHKNFKREKGFSLKSLMFMPISRPIIRDPYQTQTDRIKSLYGIFLNIKILHANKARLDFCFGIYFHN